MWLFGQLTSEKLFPYLRNMATWRFFVPFYVLPDSVTLTLMTVLQAVAVPWKSRMLSSGATVENRPADQGTGKEF